MAAATQAKFVEGNLFRHVAVMALTSSVGLMAIFFVDLINMVYISWLRDARATAAVGYAGAVLSSPPRSASGFRSRYRRWWRVPSVAAISRWHECAPRTAW
ncbi:MAG: hypothetical protein R3D84_11235 [Paracoccaceae bacterium]